MCRLLLLSGPWRLGQRSRFQEVELHLLYVLGAHDFNYPKILFHNFEEEIMLFKTI